MGFWGHIWTLSFFILLNLKSFYSQYFFLTFMLRRPHCQSFYSCFQSVYRSYLFKLKIAQDLWSIGRITSFWGHIWNKRILFVLKLELNKNRRTFLSPLTHPPIHWSEQLAPSALAGVGLSLNPIGRKKVSSRGLVQ